MSRIVRSEQAPCVITHFATRIISRQFLVLATYVSHKHIAACILLHLSLSGLAWGLCLIDRPFSYILGIRPDLALIDANAGEYH